MIPKAARYQKAIRRDLAGLNNAIWKRRVLIGLHSADSAHALDFFWLAAHAARHTVATELEALDYEEQDIARVLSHQSASITGRVYINRRSVNAQRRTLEAWKPGSLGAWERRLREIVTGEPLDNVVKLNAWNS